ncbi:hypothetical protein LWI28_009596 [Acer negundo]|uniref:Uncharacterized protein n=1 Tax=Acer negundo TaxID=4023 RepID=A0AAD5J3V4_ACENE|nr:hypothetical protein LWI28_009596 [Acer negundo]
MSTQSASIGQPRRPCLWLETSLVVEVCLVVYEVDIVAGEQAKKAKGMDRMNQKEATARLARKKSPPNRGLVEHIYEPDPNVFPEPIMPLREERG